MAKRAEESKPSWPGSSGAGGGVPPRGGASGFIFELLQAGDEDFPLDPPPPHQPLTPQEEELEAAHARIRSLTAELAGRTHVLEAHQAELRDLQEQSSHQQRALHERIAELEGERDQLFAEARHLRLRLEQRPREEVRPAVEAVPAEVEVLKRRLTQVEEARREMVGERDEALARVDELTRRLKWQEVGLLQRDERLAELELSLAELREASPAPALDAAPPGQLADLESQLQAQQALVADLESQLQAQQALVADLESRLQAQQAHVLLVERQLQGAHADLQGEQAAAALLTSDAADDIASLQARVELLLATREDLEQRLAAAERSAEALAQQAALPPATDLEVGERAGLQTRISTLEAARRELEQRLVEVEARRVELQAELRGMQGRLDVREEELRRAEMELVQSRAHARELTEDLYGARKAVREAQEEQAPLRQRARELEAQLREREVERAAERTQREQLQRERDVLLAQLTARAAEAGRGGVVEPLSPWAPGPDGTPPRGLRGSEAAESWAAGKRFRTPTPEEGQEPADGVGRRPLPPDWEVLRRSVTPPSEEPRPAAPREPPKPREIFDPEEAPEPRWRPGTDGPRRGPVAPPPNWSRPIVEIDDAPELVEELPGRPGRADPSLALVPVAPDYSEAEVRQLIGEGKQDEAERRARALWRKNPSDVEALRIYLDIAQKRRGGLPEAVAELEERLAPARATGEIAREIGLLLLRLDQTQEALGYLLNALSRSLVPADDPLLADVGQALLRLRKSGEKAVRAAALMTTFNTISLQALGPLFFHLEGLKVMRAELVVAGARPGDFLISGQERELKFSFITLPADQKVLVRPMNLTGGKADAAAYQELIQLLPAPSVRGAGRYRLTFAVTPRPPDARLSADLFELRRKDRHYVITLARAELVDAITRGWGSQLLFERIGR